MNSRPDDSPGQPFVTQRRVEFRDTDAAGIVHFSAFFPMMESAEHEMLRSLGIRVLPDPDESGGQLTWPRVAANCDYRSAARFEDLLEISVAVIKMGDSSVAYGFEFGCDGRAVATGSLTAVCCRLSPGGHLQKSTIPGSIRQKLAGFAIG